MKNSNLTETHYREKLKWHFKDLFPGKVISKFCKLSAKASKFKKVNNKFTIILKEACQSNVKCGIDVRVQKGEESNRVFPILVFKLGEFI